MRLAIDFDGTIVEHKYPAIGEIKLFAFETLRELQKQGHQLILWTYRYGQELDDAVEFCRKHGLEFYAINKSFPEEQFDESTASRKLDCDMFIDDRNLGGFVEWSEVWKMLNEGNEMSFGEQNPYAYKKQQKKSFFSSLFSK